MTKMPVPPARPITLQRTQEILERYVPSPPEQICNNIQIYIDLLLKWRRRMPLTALLDPEEIVRFHFGESIFAFSVMNAGGNGRLADVGTGAGFPGLALKLADETISVSLIESNKKKCVFLHEVIRRLSVNDAKVIAARFESAEIQPESLSFVTCRALGGHAPLLEWAREKLKPSGSVVLWLGDEDAKRVSRRLGWQWERPVLIPDTRGRYIVKGVRGE